MIKNLWMIPGLAGITRREAALLAGAAVFYSLPALLSGRAPDMGLPLLLLPAALLFLWAGDSGEISPPQLSVRSARRSVAYFAVYFIVIFKANILASSAALWLSLFLFPALLLRADSGKLAAVNFSWDRVFSGFRYMLGACLLFAPLAFFVRDSEQLLAMAQGVRFYIYLPLSVVLMVVIVAFWEEFFFRGVLQSSFKKLTGSPVTAVLMSAACFTLYHFPMRYLNRNSPCYQDAAAALTEIIGEHFVVGLFLGFAVHRTHNVWTGVWLHAFMNGLSSVPRISGWIKF